LKTHKTGMELHILTFNQIKNHIMQNNNSPLDVNKKINRPMFKDIEIKKEHALQLLPNNSEILELKKQYAKCSYAKMNHTQWNKKFCDLQIQWPYFRGDNAYVWQERDNNFLLNYEETFNYIKSFDTLRLLDILKEDGAFGIFTYKLKSGKLVSRDMLDSILELYFLERVLGISQFENLNILDIGAGYGRFAHRAINALPNINKFYCTDAIAESTFLSKFYSNYRKISNKCEVIPLHRFEETMTNKKIDIATNIHSFSECSREIIQWWLEKLQILNVRYLMIVPNIYNASGGKKLMSLEVDGQTLPYEDLVHQNGYSLISKVPKYLNQRLQQVTGVSPTYYYLYELL